MQAPIHIPDPPKAPNARGTHFLHAFGTASGFALRWISVAECPIYVRMKIGQKARLVMSLTNRITELPMHGKVVLTFEEMLACDDNTIYNTWDPAEWFPYLND
jgi:hypothetical protein